MNDKRRAAGMDGRVKISMLWIVVMINMAFADILSFITPGALQEMMTGTAGGIQLNQVLILVFAVLIEIPIAMIFLSRVLKPKLNRVMNLVAGVITIVFVIGGGSAYLHYIFIATVEVLCMLAIMWMAWKLPSADSAMSVNEGKKA